MTRSLLWLFAAVPLMAAGPTWFGQEGLFHIESAEIQDAGAFMLVLPHLHGWYQKTQQLPAYSEIRNISGDLNFGFGYAPSRNLAFSVTGTFLGDYQKFRSTADTTFTSYGFGDTRVDIKTSFGKETWFFGLNPYVVIPTGAKVQGTRDTTGSTIRVPGGLFRVFTHQSVGIGGLALFSFRDPGGFGFHLNAGGQKYIASDTLPFLLFLGAGMDFQSRYVTPLLEVWSWQFTGSSQNRYGDGPIFATLGLRLGAERGAQLDLGVNIPLFKRDSVPQFSAIPAFTPDITLDVGLNVRLAPPKEKAPAKIPGGTVAGTVQDLLTKAAVVNAEALLLKADSVAYQTTTDAFGNYMFEDVDPGRYTLRVTHPEYRSVARPVIVRSKETLTIPVYLEVKQKPVEKPKTGTLVLKLVDVESGNPIPDSLHPTLQLEGKEPVKGNTAEFTLEPGEYTVKAEAKGYIPQTRKYTVESEKTLESEIALVKKKLTIRLPKIYFDLGKATIRPESYPVLDQAAKLIKKILDENPSVKIEIQGHTDNTGGFDLNMRLSQARAEAVREYFVSMHQLPPERLIARGYGPTRPIAPNDTPWGRQQNRRVELVILGGGD